MLIVQFTRSSKKIVNWLRIWHQLYISSADELNALAGNLEKLLKITVKKIELLKSLDELSAV